MLEGQAEDSLLNQAAESPSRYSAYHKVIRLQLLYWQ
jgi:hypothetical protein